MTVKEVIKYLQTLPQDATIVIRDRYGSRLHSSQPEPVVSEFVSYDKQSNEVEFF
jgi:hypothetical protein